MSNVEFETLSKDGVEVDVENQVVIVPGAQDEEPQELILNKEWADKFDLRACRVCRLWRTDEYMFKVPCCDLLACLRCWMRNGLSNLVTMKIDGYPTCNGCGTQVVDSAAWNTFVPAEDVQRLTLAIQRAQEAQTDVAKPMREIPLADRQQAAWESGSYIHGCGTGFRIVSGCDWVAECPGCHRKGINVVGLDSHTFKMDEFFKAVTKVKADDDAATLGSLKSGHPEAWAAMYLDDLVEKIKAGDPDGWLGKMWEDCWGKGFIEFLGSTLGAGADDWVPSDGDFKRIAQLNVQRVNDTPVDKTIGVRVGDPLVAVGDHHEGNVENYLKRKQDVWEGQITVNKKGGKAFKGKLTVVGIPEPQQNLVKETLASLSSNIVFASG